MKKLPIGLLVALTTTVLSGCALYFGEGHDDDDTWNYCGADGYYQCEDESCQWVSSTCPEPGGGGQSGGGFECRDNADCAAGCYCGNGICEEAGFCTQDSDCGNGFVCNEERSSCEPGGPSCTTDNDCDAGSFCSEGTCTASCVCTSDAEAVAQGFAYCDEWRGTCMNGDDPAGTCAGEPTCNTVAPTCQPGDVPLLGPDGCWTGECQSTQHCAEPPPCKRINDSQSCLARSDCSPVYNGLNCQKPDGTACQDGDANCTCQTFVYASCRDKTASP